MGVQRVNCERWCLADSAREILLDLPREAKPMSGGVAGG
jgi:hypothetical protein